MVKILADSTCDLSKELLDKYDVDIVPLHIVMGDKEYEDLLGVTPEEIYEWADANKTTPKTSAASFDKAVKIYNKYLSVADEIVIFAISEDMSTTANVLRLAAQEVNAQDKIYVVDSENLSTGIGLLVIEASIMAKDGKSAKEIVTKMQELRPRVRSSFVVDTLTYLHRGGRCSGVAAMAGGVLKLHPKISVINGKMEPGKKYRGTIAKAVMDYVSDMESDLIAAKSDRVFITHSGCDKEIVDTVYKYLEGLGRFDEILVTRAGCVISSHCGPGTLGVLFINED